jgi:tRNA(Ile)-lysidine synthase
VELTIDPGVYVVAVSGGVDSMALLDLLRRQPEVRLVVAHFDHGTRPDSDEDRRFVQEVAGRHGLPFVYKRVALGRDASEDTARTARYDFLRQVKEASQADAIITAHHQDDLLETAILNVMRGTGPRGLVSLRSRPGLHRPLLHVPKKDLVAYAKDQGLTWREDSTNSDVRYARNYVRHQVVPRLSASDRQELLGHINRLGPMQQELDHVLTDYLHMHPGLSELDRHWFIMLPHAVAREVMLVWLQRHQVSDITSKTLERLVRAAKTYTPGRQADVDKNTVLYIDKNILALRRRDR